jgi:hypothetical protein
MYQTSGVELISLWATMGIRAHPGLTRGKTFASQTSAKPYGCAAATARPPYPQKRKLGVLQPWASGGSAVVTLPTSTKADA